MYEHHKDLGTMILILLMTWFGAFHFAVSFSFNRTETLLNDSLTSATESWDADDPDDEDIPVINTIEEFCNLPTIKAMFPDCSCETLNLTDDDPLCTKTEVKQLLYRKSWSQATAIVSTIVLFLAVLGNSIVIALSIKQWKQLTHLKQLVFALAICDFVFAVTQFSQYIRLYWTNSYLYGRIACKILQCSISTGSFIAMSIILLIVMERFVGIVFPFGIAGYKPSNRFWLIWLLVNVLIALGASIPVAIALDMEEFSDNKKKCSLFLSDGEQLALHWFIAIFYSAIPTVIMTIAYVFIFRTLSKSISKKKLEMISDPRQKMVRIRDTRRAVTVFLVVLIMFVVLVFPNRIYWLYLLYNDPSDIPEDTYLALSFVLPILAQFHVAVNPIIYSVMDPKWRKDVGIMLKICKPNQIYSRTVSVELSTNNNESARKPTKNELRFSDIWDVEGEPVAISFRQIAHS